MARKPQRGDQVTVAELLVRSAAKHNRYRFEDTVVLPRARHRDQPPLVQQKTFSLAKTRVVAVVAGALTLAGGISAAVSKPTVGPIDRSSEAAWPPLDLSPATTTQTPSPADIAGSAGRSASHAPVTAPDSAGTPAEAGGTGGPVGDPNGDSADGKPHGKPAKGKGLGLGLGLGLGQDDGSGGNGNDNGNGNGKAKGKAKKEAPPVDAGITVGTGGSADGGGAASGGAASGGSVVFPDRYTLQMPRASRYSSVRTGSSHHSCGGHHRR